MCRLNLQEKNYQQAQENSSHGDLRADVQTGAKRCEKQEVRVVGKKKKSLNVDPDCGSFLLLVYVCSYRHSPPRVLMGMKPTATQVKVESYLMQSSAGEEKALACVRNPRTQLPKWNMCF